ncbi:SCO-spondin [Bagarius yarrelli]|uniref:SCO-spondin n=1 Tax=Bagarius yarrelli TaxID=175774 RepID=A0A556TJP4_BAGYA|nr:SCO-spondin [Bagarius yarrelli]
MEITYKSYNIFNFSHWCEQRVEDKVEKIVSPRLQLEVSCSEVYQFNTQGWRLDIDRMRHKHGGDDGIAMYYKRQGPNASCYLFKAANIVTEQVNRTVRACCEGWSGPHCLQEVSIRGLCFSTWSCEEFPGVQNSSLMPFEQCCGSLWGLSWKNASDQTCLSCSYTLLPDAQPSPLFHRGLLGGIRDPKASATCMSWGGAHYRSFDKKHFHFHGGCTYVMASSTDGTWAVYISTVCDGRGHCSKALKMMLGLDLVSVHKGNISLNSVLLKQNEPFFQNGVSVHWLGDFVFVESGLGIRVKFDMGNTVYLTVSAEHFATTRGLCGLYNNNADDDFTSRSGGVLQYAASFGNSWRVPNQETEDCNDAAELGHSCDIMGDVSMRRAAELTCQQLKGRPFSQCHHRVDPGPYVDTCLYVYCSLGANERDAAVCDTLASYARECAQQHVILSWRGPGLCERVCPGGQLFSDCVSSCPPSCSSATLSASGQCRVECVGGCECPPGLYLHNGQCLRREHCPCFHRRRTYQEGDNIKHKCNTCVCQAGQWQCSAERCAAQCSIIGAMQITTFDKKRYNLQAGDCQLTAIEDFVDKKLEVTIREGKCVKVGGMRCPWETAITVLHTTVTLASTGLVMLNGQPEALPVLTADLVVRKSSSSFLTVYVFGAQLLWYTEGPLILITLQPGFAHKVRGLCGTLTWNQHDDFTTPEGDIENSVISFAAKFRRGSCYLPSAVTPDPCNTYTQHREYAENACAVIHSPVFQSCHEVVEREPYMRQCLSEVCSCMPHTQCQCTVLTAYAQHCAQEGVLVSWRNHTFCPMQCSGGQVYQECGQPCGGSCTDLQQNWSCQIGAGAQACVPGCQCPEGLAQDDQGQCVPISMCPCAHAGVVYRPGSSMQINCNTCVCKQRRWHCTQSLCAGTCVATGDPHYVTFDGRCYSFLGDCEYMLVQEKEGLFSVTAENVPCGSTGVTCTKSVTMSIGNTAIHLLRGKAVTVNGMPVTLPKSYSGSGLVLENIGLFVALSSQLGVSLLWDGGMRVYVRLEPHLQGRVGGLCGNFDGDSENDFTTRQGIVESTPELFGNSWKVSPSCPDVSEQDLRDPCNINPHRVSWAKKKCAVITQDLFAPCHAEVPHQQYYDWCVFDACGCDSGGDCECLCTAIAVYAEECNRKGVYIRWRSQGLCPMQCEDGLVYEACGSACVNGCPGSSSHADSRCRALSCVEGCFCPQGTVRYENRCIFPSECPCEWDSSLFPPGAAVTQHCQNCSCSNGTWNCTGPACPPPAPCLESEFQCSAGSHRCIPSLWLCDNEDDCGDGSDELCPTTCPPEQFRCSGGACLPIALHCNGHPDCADQSDEEFCAPVTAVPGCVPGEFRCANGRCLPVSKVCDGKLDCGFADDSDEQGCGVVCAEQEFRCSAGRCILYLHRCDGHDDCGDFSDERGCVCAAGEFQCPADQCVPAERVCDGNCNQYEFGCVNGQCVPLAWRCDGETDCLDGSDEHQCARACGPDQAPCQSGDQCVQHMHLCDGTPHCRDASDESVDNCGSTRIPPCPGSFSCDNRTCVNTSRVCNGILDCPRGEDELLCEKPSVSPLPRDERNKTHICPEFSCLDGSCVPFKLVCNGVADCSDAGIPSDEQDCQIDGHWSAWTTWSNCSKGCGGVEIRKRVCVPPQNGGQTCTELSGDTDLSTEIWSCSQDACANVSCPPGLVSHTCAPCPLTCAHISSNTSCDPSSQCFTGCWCPDKKVMNHIQQCVLPEECVCEVSGVRYWPGQQIKMGFHCGWSSWSPWGECLGPCGVQSVQWSFRSPNNPSKHGYGRQCRGIYRKARRCQTDPCEECEYQGQSHAVGDRWKGRNCHVCHCLPNLKVECAPFCPFASTGCPQSQTLIPGKGDRCCYCEDKGPNVSIITPTPAVLPITVESSRSPEVPPLVPTFPLAPGDECWSPLGVQSLPISSFSASSQQSGHPAAAGRLHYYDPHNDLQGWSPEPEEYRELPPSAPHAHTHHSQAPYLQIDLLRPYNITVIITVMFFIMAYLQVFLGNHDDHGVMQTRLDRMVLARFVRVLPHDFQNGIYLRMELMGCGDGSQPSPTPSSRVCPSGHFSCPPPGSCIDAAQHCDGFPQCPDGADEKGCDTKKNRTHVTPTPAPLRTPSMAAVTTASPPTITTDNNPADAGRLNIVPNVLVMEPGWSPLPGDPHPYFQVDFLEPTWISGIITQGSERMWGYLSKYRLAFALSENHFTDFTKSGQKDSAPKIFEVRMVGRTPVTRWLGRLVRARYLRIIPLQYRHTFYLRVEILGCRGDMVPTPGLPGLWNHTVTPGIPGYRNYTTGSPGLHTKTPQDGRPGVASVSPVSTGVPGIGPQGPTGQPGLWNITTPNDGGLPRVLCVNGQFSCKSFGCVDATLVCDGKKDCPDGSDEHNCVDCVMSSWTAWSQCSVSCGLGSLFRQRKILRDARPGGSCGGAQFDSRACFIQACPVDGQWAEWSEWSECDEECGGGVKIRSRLCSNPPPKNGGQECEGMTMQTQSCNTHPCGTGTDSQTGCTNGLVMVRDADCARGRVEPCPSTCLDLNSERNCSSECITGCRCPGGLFLQDGRCVNVSKCDCLWEGSVLQPGEEVTIDNCTFCMCRDGHVSCDNSSCIPKCDWSAWSSWASCDSSCGTGVQQRFRSVVSPSEAVNVEPCVGDSTEARQCYTPCPPVHGGWSAWSAWSDCSSECDSGVQTRERFCSSPPPLYGGSSCVGPHIQTRDCNSHPCTEVCPIGMSHLTKEQCQEQGGACPRVCLDAMSSVECTTECYDGCYCSPGYYMFNNSCVLLSNCPCYHQGVLYTQGASVPYDSCNNCTCINGEMQCGKAPCPVDCGWSEWTSWSACSRTCDVGIRRRYRSGTNPSPAFGGLPCVGDRAELDTCSVYPCSGPKGPWSTWSECSVPCGGGYRSRTRGPIRSHGTPQQFSACNLHPCSDGSGCADGQEWTACVRQSLLCSDLGLDSESNSTCLPGCQCPQGFALQDGSCVSLSLCRCDLDGKQYEPGAVVNKDCNNCTCESGRLINCTQIECNVDGGWSDWTPWSACSVSCGAGLQSRYRFCSNPERAGAGLPCFGPDRQDQACVQAACSRNGGWGEWTSWTECTKSCGGGVRSRRRECDSPATGGDGDFCEGPKTELVACNIEHCPVTQCADISGTVFSSCGPSCPRTCDDLSWRCEPGCYCIDEKVLNDNATACVEREQCPCLDLTTGRRVEPGETVLSPDGCNNCSCDGGQLTCSNNPCPVDGGWCEWSSWTPCSKTCGAELVSRYRSCACPVPVAGGAACSGQQEEHQGLGVQIERQPCPSVTFCPDCGGGQEEWPCGKPCPRSCEDLHGDTECVDTPGCSLTCGCPGNMVLKDGVCVDREACQCKFHNSTTGVKLYTPLNRHLSHNLAGLNITSTAWEWPGRTDWQYVNSGESIITDCSNCTCESGVLHCDSLPGCIVDGGWSQWGPWTECSSPCGGGVKMRFRECSNPAPQGEGRKCSGGAEQQKECNGHACTDSGMWYDWSAWTVCTVTCGGGEQRRTRSCRNPPCTGLTRQSKTCNTQVCLEVGCPPGRLYRECERGEGCPFSCAQLIGLEGCFSEGCEEGCHCPPNTYQHHGVCLQECPCLVDNELLTSLQKVSVTPELTPDLYNITVGTELRSGEELTHECSSCLCEHGLWNCSLVPCPRNGGLSPWGSWSPCSISCGSLGHKVRNRTCTNPSPAYGGQDCVGDLQETAYCQAPDCQDVLPTVEPSLSDGGVCVDEACLYRNCSWTEWGEWSVCSRSCGVGQQQRFRSFIAPGINGTWCSGIMDGNVENRFCNIRACRVDGSWSRWSPWSRCDKSCGGGRSIRTRSCSSPPPKNGGLNCLGEKNQVKPCNTKPCDERGCPPGQEFVLCANECPQRCSDLQQDIQCHKNTECQPGCRCPQGELQQEGVCVKLWQCDCIDALGKHWAAGSQHQVDCNNCSCADGVLACTNHTCAAESSCFWSSWSSWASCSVTCGAGQRTRFRSLIPKTPDADCQFEEVQHKPCDPGRCPPLCLHINQSLSVGDTWLEGECKQCTCVPEGEYCQDIYCRVDGGWTPWSVWSDCSVTCGRGNQIRTRACINPPPRNNGTHCPGAERELQDCHASPCLDDLCPWSSWTSCSRSCGAGVASRRRHCLCEEAGDYACPVFTEADQHGEETRLCYKRPCPECMEPFHPHCGFPCEKQCALQGQLNACMGQSGCTDGCYCPQGLLQQNGTCVPPEECGCVHLVQQNTSSPVPVAVPQGGVLNLGCRTCLCYNGTLQCDSRECKVSLSEWSEWTSCSPCVPASSLLHSDSAMGNGEILSEGLGISEMALVSVQRRYRTCLDVDSGLPVNESEGECAKPMKEERICSQPDVCKDLCQWSEWGPWSVCQEPCSGGFRQRERKALATTLGPQCTRQQSQSQSCNTGLCPSERCEDRGRVYEASCANQCPRSCADLWEHVQCLQGVCHPGCRCPDGWLLQDRQCVRVPACRCGLPIENGTLEIMPGQNVTVECNTCVCVNGTLVCTDQPCPTYGVWGPWSECSVSCGTGQRTRTRPCTHTPGGPNCEETIQRQNCILPACPADCVLSEWSPWSDCSVSCGGGVSVRRKTILQQSEPGGKACSTSIEQHTACNTNSCLPECPLGQVFSLCAGSCPFSCQDLWPDSQCVAGPCTPGCSCPPAMVMLNGSCMPFSECPCSSSSLPLELANVTLDLLQDEFPPGTIIPHLCNSCWSEWSTCSVSCGSGLQHSSRFIVQHRKYGGRECEGYSHRSRMCTRPDCVCPEGERWRRSMSESERVCDRGCVDMYSSEPLNCTEVSTLSEGCVCEDGSYRDAEGRCVIPALCQCEGEDGILREAGFEWEEACQTCHCVNGLKRCKTSCPPLLCDEGEVKVLEDGQCCPVCRKMYTDDVESQCQRHTEIRNITKGDCRLDNVETPVRFLSLHCSSGESEPVVLPVIQSCECTSCQGGYKHRDARHRQLWGLNNYVQ